MFLAHDLYPAFVGSEIENRPRNPSCRRPHPSIVIEQLFEFLAEYAAVSGQRDARKTHRLRHADLSVGSHHLIVSFDHVGPTGAQVGRQTGGHFGRNAEVDQRSVFADDLRGILSQQQAEGV